MKRARDREKDNSLDEATTTLPYIFTVAIDYSVDETGKPVIYEIQPFSASAPSELAELSDRKLQKKHAQVLKSLGINSDYMEFDLSNFEKLEQRRLMSKCGLQEYQPDFTYFHSKRTDEATVKDILLGFMKTRPQTKIFVLKKNSATRGEGNIFFSRAELETLLEDDSSYGSKTIYDLEMKSATMGFDPKTNSLCIETIAEKIGELEDYFLLEEGVNPQSASSAPKTFRCFAAYNPHSKAFSFQPARTYYHKPASHDSHSYMAGGSEDDFIDESHFEFNQGLATGITDLAAGKKTPEELAKEQVTRDAIEKIVTTIFDLTNLPRAYKNVRRFEFDRYDKSKAARSVPKQSGTATTFLGIINKAEYRAQVAEPLSKIENIEADLAECRALFAGETTKADVTKQNIKILQKYLPFFEIAEVRNLFARVSTRNDQLYHIKKALGLVLIGNLDQDVESEADYAAYKKTFDRFLAMPIDPEHIAAYLKKPKPLFTARMADDEVATISSTLKPDLAKSSALASTSGPSMVKY